MSYVDEKTLAKAFREWRRENQYSMRAAAKAANMTVPAVQRIEQGAIPEFKKSATSWGSVSYDRWSSI